MAGGADATAGDKGGWEVKGAAVGAGEASGGDGF